MSDLLKQARERLEAAKSHTRDYECGFNWDKLVAFLEAVVPVLERFDQERTNAVFGDCIHGVDGCHETLPHVHEPDPEIKERRTLAIAQMATTLLACDLICGVISRDTDRAYMTQGEAVDDAQDLLAITEKRREQG